MRIISERPESKDLQELSKLNVYSICQKSLMFFLSQQIEFAICDDIVSFPTMFNPEFGRSFSGFGSVRSGPYFVVLDTVF